MKSLKDEIKAFQKEHFPNLSEDFLKEASIDTKRLESLKISEDALQVGDIAKDFILPNAVNKLISLSNELKNNDYIVLNFYRGSWCPYCNIELNALKKINNEINSLNAKIIAISPETPDLSLSIQEKYNLEFEVLSDKDYLVEKEYGLVFSVDEKLRSFYESMNIDIKNATKNNSYDLPMPATYVINKNFEIIFAFIDEDYTKRCEPQDILDAIKNDSK